MRTAELTDAALDWAVAYILCKEDNELSRLKVRHGRPFMLIDGGNPYGPARPTHFSTDWAQGGPIIERKRISVNANVRFAHKEMAWVAYRSDINGNSIYGGSGPAPLIAAMRCYVASKLGDEVDVPEELR